MKSLILQPIQLISLKSLICFVYLFLGPKQFQFRRKNYFLSSHVPALADEKFDWWESRNACREYCMELVSLESEEKNNFIYSLIRVNIQHVTSIWTAGRLCDFKGCDSPDLEPKKINGWFWSSTRDSMQVYMTFVRLFP